MGTHPIFESDFVCLTVSDVKYASRIVLLFRLENPPRPRYDFCHQRWKATPIVELQVCRSLPRQKNPRKLRWTILYRRKHKKGISQEASLKRRVRRNVKAPKAIAGLSFTELLAKKQQKPEIRQKQRDNAIKAAKEKRKAAEANKAAARKAMPKVQSKAQAKMPKAPKMKGSGGKR